MFRFIFGVLVGIFLTICVVDPNSAKHMIGATVDTVHESGKTVLQQPTTIPAAPTANKDNDGFH